MQDVAEPRPNLKENSGILLISADTEQRVRSCTFAACFQEPLLYLKGLLTAERVVIKGVKHAFKLSVLLLFIANNTFQWLKGEVEGGKKELEVKEGRQGGKPKKLSKGEKLRPLHSGTLAMFII